MAVHILQQAVKTVLNPSDFLQFFSIVNLLTILILTWQRMTLFWNLNTHISHKFEFVVFYAVKKCLAAVCFFIFCYVFFVISDINLIFAPAKENVL